MICKTRMLSKKGEKSQSPRSDDAHEAGNNRSAFHYKAGRIRASSSYERGRERKAEAVVEREPGEGNRRERPRRSASGRRTRGNHEEENLTAKKKAKVSGGTRGSCLGYYYA